MSYNQIKELQAYLKDKALYKEQEILLEISL